MMCGYLFNLVYFCKLGAAFLYLQSVSASPTLMPSPMVSYVPTAAPTVYASYQLEASYVSTDPGSMFGSTISIYGEFFVVGAPEHLVEELPVGVVYMYDIYIAPSIFEVYLLCLKLSLLIFFSFDQLTLMS